MRTPASVGAEVRALCDLIRPGAKPVYLRIDPAPGCVAGDCFANVAQVVERFGGRPQFGWSLWIWPRVFVEGEHHVVWAPPASRAWRDVTPARSEDVRRRLFLPDDEAACDAGERQARRDNIRLALTADPLLAVVFEGAQVRSGIWSSATAEPGAATEENLARLQAAEFAQVDAQRRLAMKYTAPNDPCFCGRRKRFKQCHGRG